MDSGSHFDFKVYETEPLMLAVRWLRLAPVTLGIAFFLIVSLPLCILAVFSPKPPPEVSGDYLSFFENISWSLSMLYLFPFLVGLTLKYYEEIPKLFTYLVEEIVTGTEHQDSLERYSLWLRRRFNHWSVPVLCLAITLTLNAIYFWQILNPAQYTGDQSGWMAVENDGRLTCVLGGERCFTPIGLFAALIQVALIYWVLNLLWRGAALSWGLFRLFHRREFRITVEPLHPDGCCGLGRIGSVAMILNWALFALGIYISLKVVDKLVVQDLPLHADIGNPIMLGAYVIIAPLLFFLPLASAHKRMQEAKARFIWPISRASKQWFSDLGQTRLDADGAAAAQAVTQLEEIRRQMRREVPVWPFDFRSMQAFLATIVVPLLPVALPFLLKFVFGNFGG